VLWLGGPSVLPVRDGRSTGLEAHLDQRFTCGDSLFASPDSGTMDKVLSAVHSAIEGRTVRLGQLLASAEYRQLS